MLCEEYSPAIVQSRRRRRRRRRRRSRRRRRRRRRINEVHPISGLNFSCF
jgi:hypothetical protein